MDVVVRGSAPPASAPSAAKRASECCWARAGGLRPNRAFLLRAPQRAPGAAARACRCCSARRSRAGGGRALEAGARSAR
eukprot:2271830-Alexandrium_andersonii.AAC.1